MSNAKWKRRAVELAAMRLAKADTFEVTHTRTVATSTVTTCRNPKIKKGRNRFSSKCHTRSATVTTSYTVTEPKTGISLNPNYNWTGPRLGMF